MKTRLYFFGWIIVMILSCKPAFATPVQEEFYHKFYAIESKGLDGKVFTRVGQKSFINPNIYGDHISLSSGYAGNPCQKFIIAPISSGSNEFYIISKETGCPLMIDGTDIKFNTSGVTDDRQRFVFGNVNGDFVQIKSATAGGRFYRRIHSVYNFFGHETGKYYSLCYNPDSTINDDYSYFKFTAVEDIPGSGNISTANLVFQQELLNKIPEPLQLTDYTSSAPLFINETIIGESWVPFTFIKDIAYSELGKVTATPFYKLIRTQSWKKITDLSFDPGMQYLSSFKKYRGITLSDRNASINNLNHGWTIDGEAEFTSSILKGALGAAYTKKLNVTAKQVNEYNKNVWEEMDKSLVINTRASIRFIVYELVDKYYIKRMNGSNVIDPLAVFNSKFSKLRIWSSKPIAVSEDYLLNKTIVSDDNTPQNLSLGAIGNHPYLQWNASTLSGSAYYEIWRKVSEYSNDYLLIQTTKANSFIDFEYFYAPNAGDFHCNYKVRIKDTNGVYSAFTNVIGTRCESVK